MEARAIWNAACLGMLLGVAACGGGGGGETPAPKTLSASFQPASLSSQTVQGHAVRVQFDLQMKNVDAEEIFVGIEETSGIVTDAGVTGTIENMHLVLDLAGDAPVGVTQTEVRIHACLDAACTREASGSPVSVPLRYEVLPNIQVQQQLSLRRSGRDPAPESTLPVIVPASAGELFLQVTAASHWDALDIAMVDGQVRVRTRELPAGEYTATVQLFALADTRYRTTIDVRYTVEAPSGGEKALGVDTPHLNVSLLQGQRSVHRIKVQRPTWTSAWDTPELFGSPWMSLRELGNDEYELSVDATGLDPTYHGGTIRFSAGPTGGHTFVSVTLSVGAPFQLPGNLHTTLGTASTSAALRMSTPVQMTDGQPSAWTAVSLSPWLRVVKGSGTAGVDSIELEVVSSALSGMPRWSAGEIEVSVDRAGTLPRRATVSVVNEIPRLDHATSAVLVGGRGRIYVEGMIPAQSQWLLQSGVLEVHGATLESLQVVTDTRFVGEVTVLAVTVNNAVAGQPVTLRVATPLMSSQVTVATEAPAQLPSAYQALPFGAYRPPQYGAASNAVFFAGPDTVYRWGHDGATWSLLPFALPGLIDIALRGDERRLYASTAANEVWGLEPQALAVTGRAALSGGVAFDADVAPQARALTFAADGRALAAVRYPLWGDQRGAAWIAGAPGSDGIPDLATAPGQADPGVTARAVSGPSPRGVRLTRSAGGHVVAALYPGGQRTVYRPSQRFWEDVPALPAGAGLMAVADHFGGHFPLSDGTLQIEHMSLGKLGQALPATHTAGGYGMTSNGMYAVVYGYRIAVENGTERARDPALWIVDVSKAWSNHVFPVIGSIALPDAVGCTGPLAVDETCRHVAHVEVPSGAGSAFVLGPRGIAVVALPDVVATSIQAAPSRARALKAPQPQRRMLPVPLRAR